MIHVRSGSPSGSPSTSGPAGPRPAASRSRWVRGLVGVAPLALVLVLVAGRGAPDPGGAVAAEETTSAGDVYRVSSVDPPPPPRDLPPPPPSVLKCPAGFSRVGAATAPGSFCITQDQQPATSYLQAMTDCFTMNTSPDEATPHLCTQQEWYIACSQGPDVNQPALHDMTNDWEWIADMLDKARALTMGRGSCGARQESKLNGQVAFRCCIP